MQKYFIAACVVLGAASVARAQFAASPTSATSIFQPPLTLASCTPVGERTNGFIAAQPKSTPRWYRSSGTAVLRYGDRVKIAGRLIPSPNIAAQAGSLDATVAATAIVAGWQRIAAVPMPRASAIRITSESTATTVECATR